MRLDDLNWLDDEKYLEKDNRLIFVVGACEQHGYLSLLNFLDFPGTLSVRVFSWLNYVEDILKSATKSLIKSIQFFISFFTLQIPKEELI